MTDYLDSLERLANLFQKGVLSKEEFEAEKVKLLSRLHDPEGDLRMRASWFDDKRNRRIVLATVTVLLGLLLGLVVLRDVRTYSGKKGTEPPQTAAKQLVLPNPVAASIGFEDLSGCVPSQQLAELLQRIRDASRATTANDRLIYVSGSADPVEVQSSDAEIGAPGTTIAAMSIDRTWQGLHLTEIRTLDWPAGRGFELRFAESAARVSQVLHNLGMSSPKSGSLAETPGGFIGIEDLEGASGFSCIQTSLVHDAQAPSAE